MCTVRLLLTMFVRADETGAYIAHRVMSASMPLPECLLVVGDSLRILVVKQVILQGFL